MEIPWKLTHFRNRIPIDAILCSAINPLGSFGKSGRCTQTPTRPSRISPTTSNFASISTQAVNGAIQGTFGSAHYPTWGGAVTFAGSQTAHPFKIITGNVVRATFDTSGRVGIGVTPSSGIQLEIGNATNSSAVTRVTNGTVSVDLTASLSGKAFLEVGSNHPLVLATNATEAARITSGGTLLVGTTGGSTYSSTVNEGVEIAPDFIGVARNQSTVMHLNRQGNDGTIVDFRTYGFVRGSVSISGSTTSYNTSSDERLKDNIKDADDSGSKVDAIQVRQFDWKAGGEHQDYGMVAQELLEVAPDAVTKGDTPDDMMGVDYSKLVPMLIKEIQSLRQRVAQLEE